MVIRLRNKAQRHGSNSAERYCSQIAETCPQTGTGKMRAIMTMLLVMSVLMVPRIFGWLRGVLRMGSVNSVSVMAREMSLGGMRKGGC